MGVIHASGSLQGNHTYLRLEDPSNATRMGFSLLTVDRTHAAVTEGETALVLLSGKGSVAISEQEDEVSRGSLFDEHPWAFALPEGTPFEIKPDGTMEFAVIASGKSALRKPRILTPDQVSVEHRGSGILEDTSYRLVRLAFDCKTLPESNIVLGEVVNQQGRWSSYPPHHHPQPELYFYRFLPQQGYGFCQLGDQVVQVRHNSLAIIEGVDHPQVSAPGYAMWYLWAVRHLPGKPYTGFEFAKEHEWTMARDAKLGSMEGARWRR